MGIEKLKPSSNHRQEEDVMILENGGGEGRDTDDLKEKKGEEVEEDESDESSHRQEQQDAILDKYEGEEGRRRRRRDKNVGEKEEEEKEIKTVEEKGGDQDSSIINSSEEEIETLRETISEESLTKNNEDMPEAPEANYSGGDDIGEDIGAQASMDQNAYKVPEETVLQGLSITSEKQQQPNGDGNVGGNGGGDMSFHRIATSPIPIPDTQEPATQYPSTSGSNIVGDILYNLAVSNEEGHSRQHILAFAANRYAANVERNPEDHDALYNWALVLQESADTTRSEMDSISKDALLDEACKKYEGATRLCPTLHEAYYNWAIAISDRAKIRGRTKEAEELWKQACVRYDQSVQLNWNNPQALNNWGLALQELGAIVPLKEKHAVVKKAIRKFRAAFQLQFDFHRAVYNLGTVLYGLAEDTSRSGQKMNTKELPPADLYSLSAVYIAAAHALKPEYPVYQGALRLVRSMLPLPYMKAGWLKIAPPGNPLAPHCDWMRLWFVLDHKALYEMEKVDRKSLAHSYSRRVTFADSSSSSLPARPSLLRIGMEDIVHMAPSADLSLPSGSGFCIDTVSGPHYLIAETWNAMDAWVDAVRLVYTIYVQGKKDVLAGVLGG
ncbi:unnamed protein product [Sphagnum troendelagicum]|uniref:PH domain-containing protein n=1 Tax=Sphagnum troendelagicum TaxID=128251 RepID=A0ABP0V1E4_9BRYO